MATVEELQKQINALLKQIQSLQGALAKEGVNNLEKQPSDSDKLEIRIVPDSSWLIALLDENDSHHIPTTASFGALLPYKPTFYIPALVYLESLSRLIRINKMPVKKCVQKIDRFLSKIEYKHSRTLEISEILQKYKTFSRVKISKMHPLDFYIVTEGVFLNAKILTCDLKMYRYVRRYYKKIYFITDKVEEKDSDLGSLIRDIQNKEITKN